MSVLVKWSKLKLTLKKALILLRNSEDEFDSIAESLGFKSNELADLKILMKELSICAPYLVKKKEKKEDEKENVNNKTKQLIYNSDFDTNGLIYFIGTKKLTSNNFINPQTTNDVIITSSSIYGSQKLKQFISRHYVDTYTNSVKNSYVEIDFKNYKIKPTHYTLRHGYHPSDAYLITWRLEGVNELTGCKILKEHTNDHSLKGNKRTFTWRILNCNEFYSRFRIVQYDVNSRPDHVCHLSLYVTVYDMCNLRINALI